MRVIVGALASALFLAPTALAQDAALIEQGKYLATAADCVSCHTRPGGEPFAGGVEFKTPFGTIYSPNITAAGIGNWTEEQFGRALREGVAADGSNLYPVLPYPEFTKISDTDVHALFAYVTSLKPANYTPPQNEMSFPFGMRRLLSIWKALFFEPGRYAPATSQNAEWNRGAYLVQSLGHCGACHTPRNSFGAEQKDLAYTGGAFFEQIKDMVEEGGVTPQQGMIRTWGAVNLTPHASGLGAWSLDEIAEYLRTGTNKRAGEFGPMSPILINSMQKLTEADQHAIAVYLKSLPAKTGLKVGKTPEDSARKGKSVFEVRCSVCHQSEGLGIPQEATGGGKGTAPLVGSAIIQAPNPASLINVILYGTHPTVVRPDSWPRMPGYANDISVDDDQIADLCNYLRSAWGNQGDPVDAKTVAQQR